MSIHVKELDQALIDAPTRTVICVSEPHPTIRFAARELARYLSRATGQQIPIIPSFTAPSDVAALRLNLLEPASDDDRIRITPEDRGYRLEGSNPRSVLFAVYRYLRTLGFRWIRPGTRGEIIPRLASPVPPDIFVDEVPSYRYRTICIEGAASSIHVIQLIDWAAKQGMNGYFVQFDLAHGEEFWERWYHHADNPYWQKEPINAGKVARITAAITHAIEKRGLRFESMGHGWTAAALGVAGIRGIETKEQIPVSRRAWLAEIGGKRDVFPGGSGNTNLCYSNPDARSAMVGPIVEYARTHPQVTALHVWQSDGCNNNCECADCQKARPADYYVDVLNELDAELTAAGLHTKIVFLIYVDLLWPPLQSRLRNPDRFILMFAPISRSYAESYADIRRVEPIAPYTRNTLAFPAGVAENVAYLQAWQQVFTGDSFDFDYHLIWMPYGDLAQFTLARVLHRDIQALAQINLNGYNSCQNQRQSFPHNLAMDVMARTLWDRSLSFEQIATETFTDTYGSDGQAVAQFLERMSALSEPVYEWVHHKPDREHRIAAGLNALPEMRALIQEFRGVVRRHIATTTGAVRWSWRYLGVYLEIMARLIPALDAYLRCEPDCREKYAVLFDYLRRKEKMLHPDLDVWQCIRVLGAYVDSMEREGLQAWG